MNVSRVRNICCMNLLKLRCAYSSVAKPETEIEILPKQDVKITKNVTGITLASVENYSPVSHISLLVKAGSRYETGKNSGIAHCLRTCTAISTKNHSGFAISRSLERLGAKLSVTSTREHLVYSLQCSRDHVDVCLEILADVATEQAFKSWEVRDASERMHIDLAVLKSRPEAVLMEALHKAAFRGGLGHSLYSKPYMVGQHTPEMLQAFVRENFTASRTSIIGLGISHDHFENAVAKLFNVSENSSGSNEASKFGAGELRMEANIPYTQVAIVAEGAKLTSVKEMLSLGVLQCILGTGAVHTHSTTRFSKLGEAAAKSASNPFAVSTLNVSYSDTGLFGVYIAGCPDEMDQLVKSVVSKMRDSTKNITEETVQAAKHSLKTRLHLERERSDDLAYTLALEATSFGQVRNLKDLSKSVDELKASDITAIAGKVMKSKPAMAAVGHLHATPHLDELL